MGTGDSLYCLRVVGNMARGAGPGSSRTICRLRQTGMRSVTAPEVSSPYVGPAAVILCRARNFVAGNGSFRPLSYQPLSLPAEQCTHQNLKESTYILVNSIQLL